MKSFVFQNCKFNLVNRDFFSSDQSVNEIRFETNDHLYFFCVNKIMANDGKSFTINYGISSVKYITFTNRNNKIYRTELFNCKLRAFYFFNSRYNYLEIKSGFRNSFFEAKREAIRIKDLAEIYI